MARHVFWVLLLVSGLAAAPAGACTFDTDCMPGSKCVKSGGALYGVCTGGNSPGNENDRNPAHDFSDPNETVGSMCWTDVDCGPGSKCAKSSGSTYGVCVR